MKEEEKIARLRERALELGAHRAEVMEASRVSLDASFRELCKANSCGNYGKNYMCPPDIGDIHSLMDEIRTYDAVLVYQTVGQLEDSYDFEGMMEAGRLHNGLAQKLREETQGFPKERILHLAAGGCRVCETCGKRTGEPCRFPGKAIGSLEAYGINVSLLAKESGMKYINGADTVTYFGAIFFRNRQE
ncbi:MAG TPA: DUF2284 domain-containing protein [Candidatus Eisenbergiella merdigallinarum]|uniref:DUF2284 domain-containing protein n=1 Tax=Candidatus Eisenbergiella merdigallinarum TaxID=2838552 RepID=A0A9D2MNW8_9FIRM|nr:DUF2284 domain-containing protein [Candidatus Eisenbergiella merdigallinarum]